MSKVSVPRHFAAHIGVAYPPNNGYPFEEWFNVNYDGCSTDRLFLDVNFTSYLVNNNYAAKPSDVPELQSFIDQLPRDKKYFCICQYDLGVVVDFKDLDVLQYNMSKQIGVQIGLLCQRHPYQFNEYRTRLANFVGSRTHPIRDNLDRLKNIDGYYISFLPHDIEHYCKIMSQSIFTLAPRGFGANSFRIAEAMQYGSIPVYISDEFILPFGVDFNRFGVLIEQNDAGRIEQVLELITPIEIIEKQNNLPGYYNEYYSFEGNMNSIKQSLETEYHNREHNG
jgi:hypothetical protein